MKVLSPLQVLTYIFVLPFLSFMLDLIFAKILNVREV